MMIRRFAVALLAVLLLASAPACVVDWGAIVNDVIPHVTPKPDPPKPDVPPVEAPYVVAAGQRVERSLTVPCWLEIQITGKQPGSPEREEVTMWAVSPAGGDWRGSNPAPGTASASCRDYNADRAKFKVYGLSGFSGEPFLPVAWSPATTYTERLEITATRATWIVSAGGREIARAAQDATFAGTATLGYGDPPSKRKGAYGAKVTGVRWSEP